MWSELLITTCALIAIIGIGGTIITHIIEAIYKKQIRDMIEKGEERENTMGLHTQYLLEQSDECLRTLIDQYPELDFYSNFDIKRRMVHVAISDSTCKRCESGGFEKEVIKEFFYNAQEMIDPVPAYNEISEWCENYLRPKKIETIAKAHHCECCGAPMPKGAGKCTYCGTEYY